MRHLIKFAFVAPLMLPSPALADALQQQVLAGAKSVSPGDFAFTQNSVFERAGKPPKLFVSHFDPKKPAGSRWTFSKVDGRVPTAKDIAASTKRANSNPVPTYSDIGKWFGAPATRTATNGERVTYHFARLPAGVMKFGNHDASADTSADAIVNTGGKVPFVENVRFISTKPFRMALVAKLERLVITSSNRLMPDGRPVPMLIAFEMRGSLFGKSDGMKTVTNFVDVRSVQ